MSGLPAVDRFAGFAEAYDEHRPGPPDALGEMLSRLAKTAPPALVVDIACGTGLSTRFWAGRAGRVLGVDPSAEMLGIAMERTDAPNVSYRFGLGQRTGLPDGCADIVTCSNALHWMEPEPTLTEIARLLRPGGVFAAYYHDPYPSTSHPEADGVFRAFRERAVTLDGERGITATARKWDRSEHLLRMRESGLFRHAWELRLQHAEEGDAERLVGLAMSDGFVRGLMKAGVSEDELGLGTIKSEIHRLLGDERRPWRWKVYVWVGVAWAHAPREAGNRGVQGQRAEPIGGSGA